MNTSIDNSILRSEERAIFALRALYRSYGYLPFKMSKFEAYDFYLQNKDFLVSDRIITFNDTNGKLLALKPDVTLSIVKNGEDADGVKQKVCYNENVYRVSENTQQYKEIMQTGIECIGAIDSYDIYEMLLLACKSLELLSSDFVLEISHLDLISQLLKQASDDKAFHREAMQYISEKNAHDLQRICQEQQVSPDLQQALLTLVQAYGPRDVVLAQLRTLPCLSPEILAELGSLSRLLDALPCSEKIVFDFSCLNNSSYYNGIVFRGYLAGLSQSVLTGGQYDKLLKKMKRSSGAIGFAIYLDVLSQLPGKAAPYDVDLLLLYNQATDKEVLAQTVERHIQSGRSVSAQTAVPEKLRYQELLDLREED